MPINLPEAGLDRYINNPEPGDFLQRATDLFSLATGITTLPSDALEIRIVSTAIYQMAWFLMEDHNNREAYMSNFASERIGSYSYSKGGSSEDENNMYGKVPAFDFAIEYFANKNIKDNSTVTSEHVFEQGYKSDFPVRRGILNPEQPRTYIVT